MTFLNSILPQVHTFLGNAGAPEGANMTRTLMFFGVVLVFFYLILWRPEQKRRKKMQQTRSSLKPGDQVLAMGILGEVTQVNEESQTVILKLFDGAKIEVLKQAITEVRSTQQVSEKVKTAEVQEATK